MKHWICVTCGTQFAPSTEPPKLCSICNDERQYVRRGGQKWTTIEEMEADGFHTMSKLHEAGLTGIGTQPIFAIGQRALLVQTKHGNVLWDCISLLDEHAITIIQQQGGLKAIAISHPHYYASMVEWADYFDVPIYLNAADSQWVMRPSKRIMFWTGEIFPLPDLEEITLICLGGHFPGGTVLHWAHAASDGKGVLLTGDSIAVVADPRWVSFMYSYPNLIPLSANEVLHIRNTIASYHFTRLYGAWFSSVLEGDAHAAVLRSADRYLKKICG